MKAIAGAVTQNPGDADIQHWYDMPRPMSKNEKFLTFMPGVLKSVSAAINQGEVEGSQKKAKQTPCTVVERSMCTLLEVLMFVFGYVHFLSLSQSVKISKTSARRTTFIDWLCFVPRVDVLSKSMVGITETYL